jgi:hypothetical protein
MVSFAKIASAPVTPVADCILGPKVQIGTWDNLVSSVTSAAKLSPKSLSLTATVSQGGIWDNRLSGALRITLPITAFISGYFVTDGTIKAVQNLMHKKYCEAGLHFFKSGTALTALTFSASIAGSDEALMLLIISASTGAFISFTTHLLAKLGQGCNFEAKQISASQTNYSRSESNQRAGIAAEQRIHQGNYKKVQASKAHARSEALKKIDIECTELDLN